MSPLNFTYATRVGFDHLILDWTSKRAIESRHETWATLWDSLRDAIFSRHGIDVCEIGTTWLPTLVGMNALRPFQLREVDYMGSSKAFSPPVWKTTQLAGDKTVWSIPWTLDTRVIYYWSDMLDAAGLDPATAFSTPQQMFTTMDALRGQVETPWAVNTFRETISVQNIASWLWQSGADFVSENGHHTRFAEPHALEAIQRYYDLYAYMPQQSEPFTTDDLADLFTNRRIAAVMNGPWFTGFLHDRLGSSDAFNYVRVALPPGPPFLGGTNLVILSHTSPASERSAIELIKWLVSKDSQEQFYHAFGMLPVRSDVFTDATVSDNPIAATYLEAARAGRPTASIMRWGLVEERLVDAFASIWADIQSSHKSVAESVNARLQRAAQSLDGILAQ